MTADGGGRCAAAGELARASLHLAQAAIDEHEGRVAAARAALGRAQGAFLAGGIAGVAAIELGSRRGARACSPARVGSARRGPRSALQQSLEQVR